MSDSTRLWLIRARHQTLATVIERCRGTGVTAVHSDTTPRSIHAARELCASLQLSPPRTAQLAPRRGDESRSDFEHRLAATLAHIAASSPGAQLALVTTGPVVRTILQITLGLPTHSARGLLPPRNSPSAVDWPATPDPRSRPALLGIDLDWTPPPPSPQRAKFPGGPGSAPSARAS